MLRAAVEGSAMSDHDEIAWTITWSGDIPVAIIFSKEHAAQAARIAVCGIRTKPPTVPG
jgi:hypothetical protein